MAFSKKINDRLNKMGSEAALVLGIIDMYLSKSAEARHIQASLDEHKLWAITELLAVCEQRERMVDCTLEFMAKNPVGVSPLFSEVEVALVGASKPKLERLVPLVIATGRYDKAQELIDLIGRDFKPREVRAIGTQYREGTTRGAKLTSEIEAIYQRVLGPEGVAEFRKLFG